MSKVESSLETTFNGKAVKYRFLSLKLVALSRNGFPDRTCIGKYQHIFFVELKRDDKKSKDKKVKKHQNYWHKILRKLGFRVYVCDNKEEAEKIFKYEAEVVRPRLSKRSSIKGI